MFIGLILVNITNRKNVSLVPTYHVAIRLAIRCTAQYANPTL